MTGLRMNMYLKLLTKPIKMKTSGLPTVNSGIGRKIRKDSAVQFHLILFKKMQFEKSHGEPLIYALFYAGLFQQIKLEDLSHNNAFFPFCADVASMFAMIEMAGTHIKFIPEVLYIYNDDNPLSYHHDPTPQRELEAYIRTMPRYEPLKEKVW